MAYISQEEKKAIVKALKDIVPKNWKVTYGVNHHSTFVMRISEADINLPYEFRYVDRDDVERNADGCHHTHVLSESAGTYYGSYRFVSPDVLVLFKSICETIHSVGGWFDNSDLMTDYHNTAFYVDIKFGTWDKPFNYNPPMIDKNPEKFEEFATTITEPVAEASPEKNDDRISMKVKTDGNRVHTIASDGWETITIDGVLVYTREIFRRPIPAPVPDKFDDKDQGINHLIPECDQRMKDSGISHAIVRYYEADGTSQYEFMTLGRGMPNKVGKIVRNVTTGFVILYIAYTHKDALEMEQQNRPAYGKPKLYLAVNNG